MEGLLLCKTLANFLSFDLESPVACQLRIPTMLPQHHRRPQMAANPTTRTIRIRASSLYYEKAVLRCIPAQERHDSRDRKPLVAMSRLLSRLSVSKTRIIDEGLDPHRVRLWAPESRNFMRFTKRIIGVLRNLRNSAEEAALTLTVVNWEFVFLTIDLEHHVSVTEARHICTALSTRCRRCILPCCQMQNSTRYFRSHLGEE